MAVAILHDHVTPCKSRPHIIKTFRDRDDWIEQLLAADVSLGAKVVGSRIAHHHNIERGQCNPGIETLVDGTGISQSSVRRHVVELEDAGWLRVDRTFGRYSNSYELRVPTLSAVTGFNPVNCERVEDTQTLPTVTPQPCQNRANPVTHERLTTNLRTVNRTRKEIDSPALDLGEEEDGRREVDLPSQPDNIEAEFETFWTAYPKKVDRAKGPTAESSAAKRRLRSSSSTVPWPTPPSGWGRIPDSRSIRQPG